ncbi:MAG: IS1634 family transposase [Desulfuromonadaceae bacterium]|nr:IS1634 family transposase [Desulfuromonadaceae bacterium]
MKSGLCHPVSMYIRQTKTRSSKNGEDYYTFRLVASERVGTKVKQRTLLNLGRNFSLPKEHWPQLCARIDQILSGQEAFLPESAEVEVEAQRYAARLVVLSAPAAPVQESSEVEYQEVDIDSLELVRPRSVGVEHVGLSALSWLEMPQILESVGFNGVQRAAALGSIIGRMAAPGSELATYRWLTERSALGELLDTDFEAMPLMRLYRVSDLLVRHRQAIEEALFPRIQSLFTIPETVTLYDLTNTYFEGEMAGNAKARRGRSKEKRSDCPLVTLGLVLDGSGFVRRSQMFEGNVSEGKTLEGMLRGLDTPPGALVVMDAGIATEANIAWLVEHHYRYLVVSRERRRQFDESQAVATTTASEQTIRIQRVLSEGGKEVRLYCHSPERQEKETAMAEQFTRRFEEGLTKLAEGLQKPRNEKRPEKLLQRIGRLKAKSHGIGQHYTVELILDESGTNAVALSWEKQPVDGTLLTHPGVYCLRTNELNWDEATLWRTYTMLTDLEAVFRSLKSELGLRPVYHHKEERAEGHLFITVLAYQAVQALRQKLKTGDIVDSWSTLRETFSVQQRVTATFKQRDGRTLHVRKATVAEPKLKRLYDVLGLSAAPGGIQKLIN